MHGPVEASSQAEPSPEAPLAPDGLTAPATQAIRFAWLRWLSLPSALLGIYAFFLPWVYISCGSIKGNISGSEFATGAWEEKIGAAKARKLKERLQVDKARRIFSPDRPGDKGQTILNPEQPLLWIIPAAMAVAALLIAGNAPRLLSLAACAVVACALGYFKYRFALEVSNARVPGQVTLRWLDAYWLSWAGVTLLALVALIAPRKRRPSEGKREAQP